MPTLAVSQIHPLPGYIVVEPADSQKQTDSGIFLPDSGSEKPQFGSVVAVSDSVTNEHGVKVSCPVKVGDTVLYKKWGGNEVKASGKEIQVMRYEDLIAVVK